MISLMRVKPVFVIALALSLASDSTSASAANIISFNFTAIVNSVTDNGGLLGGTISAGQTLTGSFQYDLDAPDGTPADPTRGDYLPGAFPMSGLSVTNGAFSYSVDDFYIGVFDNFSSSDQFIIESGENGISSPPAPQIETLIVLGDNDSTVFSSDALPTSFGSLAEYENNEFGISNADSFPSSDPDYVSISTTITSITQVPEPSTGIGLQILGLAGLDRGRRKRT